VPFALEAFGGRRTGACHGNHRVRRPRRPGTRYRTFWVRAGLRRAGGAAWRPIDSAAIDNDAFEVSVDPATWRGIVSLVDKPDREGAGATGEVANELRAYREYPNHPLFEEGPWHLTPDGRFTSATMYPVRSTVEASPIGRRIRVEGVVRRGAPRDEIRLWTASTASN
jgi:alpha-mannosidase